MIRLLTIISVLTLSLTASAQDRSGRNTPSDWRVEHYVPFGLWDSICDERAEDDVMKQRCYLRYVEVYSPRPNFLAAFAFVHSQAGKSVVEFGFERRTQYADGGLRVVRNGETAWQMSDQCLRASPCRLIDNEAILMLEQFAEGGMLVQEFRDRKGGEWLLEWDLARFGEALVDYRRESRARALLN